MINMKHIDSAMALVDKIMNGPEMSPAAEDATMKKMLVEMKAHKAECMKEENQESAVTSTLSKIAKN